MSKKVTPAAVDTQDDSGFSVMIHHASADAGLDYGAIARKARERADQRMANDDSWLAEIRAIDESLPLLDPQVEAEANSRRVALLQRQRGEWIELRRLALRAARDGDRFAARSVWLSAEALTLILAGERATAG